MFGGTNIVKNSEKNNWVYSGFGIAFDGGDWLSFGNGTARIVIIPCVDNSSSSHADNLQNNFLILGLGLTFRITGSFGFWKKKFSINFTKAHTQFCLSLNYNAGNS